MMRVLIVTLAATIVIGWSGIWTEAKPYSATLGRDPSRWLFFIAHLCSFAGYSALTSWLLKGETSDPGWVLPDLRCQGGEALCP